MDPPTSFKIPLMLRQRRINRSLHPETQDRLNRSFASMSSLNNSKIQTMPKVGIKLNSFYRADFVLAKSESSSQFSNFYKSPDTLPIIDKIFFKRKDEMANYSEFLIRNKLIYSKK